MIRILISINQSGVPDFWVQSMPAVPRVGEKVNIGNLLKGVRDIDGDPLSPNVVEGIQSSAAFYEVKNILWDADRDGYYALLEFDSYRK